MDVNILLTLKVNPALFHQPKHDLKAIVRYYIAREVGKFVSDGESLKLISSAVVNVDEEFGTIFIENSNVVMDLGDENE